MYNIIIYYTTKVKYNNKLNKFYYMLETSKALNTIINSVFIFDVKIFKDETMNNQQETKIK